MNADASLKVYDNHPSPPNICVRISACKGTAGFINNNHEKRYCQLGFEGCRKIIDDLEFTVSFVSLPNTVNPCFQWEWVPVAEVIDDKAIPCNSQSSTRVGRLERKTENLVGKLDGTSTIAWKNGNAYKNADETKVLQSCCSADWVAYTPDDPFPAGTVIAGYLSDPFTETPIIRGLTSGNNYQCGYYNPNTHLGYIVHRTPEVTTEIDILVLA